MPNASINVYTSSVKVNPTRAASICTHKQEFSADKIKRDKCTSLSGESTCIQEGFCYFTPTYVLKQTNVGCGPGAFEIKWYTDKVYTLDECDQHCINHRDCVNFFIGKVDANKGHCVIFKTGCTFLSNPMYDAYTSTVKVNPSRAASVCTHLQSLSGDKVKRDSCSGITDK